MTNFMKTTTTAKVDMGAILNYISQELHRLVSKGSDVSFRVSHYIPQNVDLQTRSRYLENLYILVEVKLKKFDTIYTTQPIYVCYERKKEYTEATLSVHVEQALQKILAELKSDYRKDLVKSLSDGAEFFKSLGK